MTHEVEAAAYILRAMEEIEKNGDPYANDEELYQACRLAYGVTFNAYRADKAVLVRAKALRVEGKRIYRARMCSYENFAAKRLAKLLGKPQLDVPEAENPLKCGDVILNVDQREAVLLGCGRRRADAGGNQGYCAASESDNAGDLQSTVKKQTGIWDFPRGRSGDDPQKHTAQKLLQWRCRDFTF